MEKIDTNEDPVVISVIKDLSTKCSDMVDKLNSINRHETACLNMNRASPIELRKSLEAGKCYAAAGIAFVPVPVMNDMDNNNLVIAADERLKTLIEIAELEEGLKKYLVK